MNRILIIEDEEVIRKQLSFLLISDYRARQALTYSPVRNMRPWLS